MKNLKETYFSPLEMARIHGISKSLLLYYDRENIFLPEITDEKGCRFYSLQQCFELKILIDLRKLGVPLPDIAYYLQNRNAGQLQTLFEKRTETIQAEAVKLQKQLDVIRHLQKHVQQINTAAFNTICFMTQPEKYLQVSYEFEKDGDHKNWLSVFLQRDQNYYKDTLDVNPYFGVILKKENFQKQDYSSAPILYQEIPQYLPGCKIRPAGHYLTLIRGGSKKQATAAAGAQIYQYIQTHHLTITSDLFAMPLQNYWTTRQIDQYVFQYEMQIESPKERD